MHSKAHEDSGVVRNADVVRFCDVRREFRDSLPKSLQKISKDCHWPDTRQNLLRIRKACFIISTCYSSKKNHKMEKNVNIQNLFLFNPVNLLLSTTPKIYI